MSILRSLFLKVEWVDKMGLGQPAYTITAVHDRLWIMWTLIRQRNPLLPNPDPDQWQPINIFQSSSATVSLCLYQRLLLLSHFSGTWLRRPIRTSAAPHFFFWSPLRFLIQTVFCVGGDVFLACATRQPPHSCIPRIHPPRASSHTANVQMRCLVF